MGATPATVEQDASSIDFLVLLLVAVVSVCVLCSCAVAVALRRHRRSMRTRVAFGKEGVEMDAELCEFDRVRQMSAMKEPYSLHRTMDEQIMETPIAKESDESDESNKPHSQITDSDAELPDGSKEPYSFITDAPATKESSTSGTSVAVACTRAESASDAGVDPIEMTELREPGESKEVLSHERVKKSKKAAEKKVVPKKEGKKKKKKEEETEEEAPKEEELPQKKGKKDAAAKKHPRPPITDASSTQEPPTTNASATQGPTTTDAPASSIAD